MLVGWYFVRWILGLGDVCAGCSIVFVPYLVSILVRMYSVVSYSIVSLTSFQELGGSL